MRLSPIRLGLALGSTWGFGIFVVSLIAIAQDQTHLAFDLLSIYPGYGLTLSGAALGFLWGFVDGFFAGYVIAWVYNAFDDCGMHSMCCKKERCEGCGACGGCGSMRCDSCENGACKIEKSQKKVSKPKHKPTVKDKKK